MIPLSIIIVIIILTIMIPLSIIIVFVILTIMIKARKFSSQGQEARVDGEKGGGGARAAV